MIQPSIRLEVSEVSKRFGGVTALANVSLEARSGEVVAICGENGAGKSTLMKILSGAITDYEGTIRLHGAPVRFRGPRDAEEQGVSIIYQELNLVPELSAAANIFLGRERTTAGVFLNDRLMRQEAEQYFQQLGVSFSPRTKVRDLRIGDQQLVEIAKALSFDADILIMDEPTSALADQEVDRLYGIIDGLKDRGVTVLYISHKMNEVFHVADRIVVLRDGRNVQTLDREEATPVDVIRLMVGRDIADLPMAHESSPGREVLRVENLSLPHRERPGAWQLNDVSFRLHSGEIVGIAGLLGAGRTELLESIFGCSPRQPTGEIYIQGMPVTIADPAQAIELGIALVTEDRKNLGIFPELNVGRNITIAHMEEIAPSGFISTAAEKKAAADSIERLGIKTDGRSASILSLSGGNQQKCILARWLLTGPRILLLDEPTRGIDVGAKADIYCLLRQLGRDGIGIVMTSSELPELLAVCDRILVLCEGRITAEFARSEATEENILEAAMRFENSKANAASTIAARSASEGRSP